MMAFHLHGICVHSWMINLMFVQLILPFLLCQLCSGTVLALKLICMYAVQRGNEQTHNTFHKY